MSEEKKDYVVYGMRAKCSEGTMENYISTDVGHGVTYQGQPLLNANDHTAQVNLTHFGDCNSKKIYEDAKKQADEKYKADADDGFFAKAGKWIAKTVTKAAINVQEHLMFHKCELDTPLPWMFCNEEHMIDGAPALTLESQCPCRRGGVITIVPVVEEETAIEAEESAEEVEAATKEVALGSVMAGAAQLGVQTLSAGSKGKVKVDSIMPRGGVANIIDNNDPESVRKALEETRRMVDRAILEKYVNEETLGKINPEWTKNMKTFKELYGEDVFEQMREGMYNYGITDKVSILMFLSTIGVETGHGEVIKEHFDGETTGDIKTYFKAMTYEYETRGAGVMQITGATQKVFLEYIKENKSLNKEQIEELDRYIASFSTVTHYNNGEDIEATACSLNVADYIVENYSVESAAWYWAVYRERGETINNFAVEHKNDNLYNTFIGTQYMVNGTEYKLDRLNTFCEYKNNCKIVPNSACPEHKNHMTGYCFTCPDEPDRHSYGPNGWAVRELDWLNAEKILQEKE